MAYDYGTANAPAAMDPAALAAWKLGQSGIPPAAAGTAGLGGLLTGLSGVGAPPALPPVDYSGGVSGAQQAPDAASVASAGGANLMELLKAGMVANQPQASLGALIAQGGIRA